MDKVLKIGVIGCGRIALSAHLPSYKNNKDCEIVYVCDVIEEKAQKASETFGGKVVTDYKVIINDPEIDAISICTPNDVHALISVEALKAGKQVLCEKPAARTLDEALMMQKAKNELGGILNIGVVNRFNNAVNKVKELIENGDLGNVYHVYTSFRCHRSIPGIGGAFTRKDIAGGGVLIDWGVHFIDLILYCLGEPKAKTVSAEAFSHLGKNIKDYTYDFMWAEDTKEEDGVYDVEESIVGLIRCDNHVISINGAWAQNIGEDEMYIDFMGDKAGIRLIYGKDFKLYGVKNGMLTQTEFKFKTTDHYQNEIDAFVDYIKTNNDSSRASINVNIETSKIMDALYRSAKEHKEITL